MEVAVQPPAPQRSSQAKPAPMAPPAPGSGSSPASCDVTGPVTVGRGGGSRKKATLCGPSPTVRLAAPPTEEMERPGRRIWSPSNLGRAPASAPPRVPFPPPLPIARGWPLGFRTCAAGAWGRGEFGGVFSEGLVEGMPESLCLRDPQPPSI